MAVRLSDLAPQDLGFGYAGPSRAMRMSQSRPSLRLPFGSYGELSTGGQIASPAAYWTPERGPQPEITAPGLYSARGSRQRPSQRAPVTLPPATLPTQAQFTAQAGGLTIPALQQQLLAMQAYMNEMSRLGMLRPWLGMA
jgi:hypothetical protein